MRLAICRVIGNELPPRDLPGGKLRSLQHILNTEKNVDRIWILNHVHDHAYRQKVIHLLTAYGERFHELLFDPYRYFRLSTLEQQICYAINVNEARNVAIALTRPQYDFAVCLDQDCFFTAPLWEETTEFIRKDQSICRERQYYGVLTKRLMSVDSTDVESLPDDEPQLICRSDAAVLFDPTLPFGRGDKMTLLHALGYGRSPAYALRGDTCRTAGHVLHVRCGEPEAEVSLSTRMRARAQAIQALLDQVETRYSSSGPPRRVNRSHAPFREPGH
jgi:hypothetical protein